MIRVVDTVAALALATPPRREVGRSIDDEGGMWIDYEDGESEYTPCLLRDFAWLA